MIPLGVLASARVAAAGSTVLPTDYASLAAWFKADSITLSDGSDVLRWSNSSGSGGSAVGTAGTTGVYRASLINGLPAVDFDGANDWMNATAFLTHGEQTVFAVIRLDAFGATQMVRGTAGGGGISMDINESGQLALGVSGQAHTVTSAALSTGVWYVVSGAASSVLDWMRVRVNGAQTQATWTGSATTARGCRISNDTANAGGKMNGQIAELFWYTDIRSDAEILALEDYLATKYGL